MNPIDRIIAMERALDASAEAVKALSDALRQYASIRPELEALRDYYESPDWLADCDADAAGALPQTLKRGVLSEDAVYDLLDENDRLLESLRKIAEE